MFIVTYVVTMFLEIASVISFCIGKLGITSQIDTKM